MFIASHSVRFFLSISRNAIQFAARLIMPIQHVTALTYMDAILEADKPVLVEFWKPGCSVCLSMSNIIHDVVTDLCGLVGLVKVNTDEVPAATKTFHVDTVPRLLVLDRGRIVGDFSGVVSKHAILDVLKPFMRYPRLPEAES